MRKPWPTGTIRSICPLWKSFAAHKVLDDFPGRTESDLYLWIVEHLYFLRETEQDTSLEEAAEDYADQYSEKSIKRLVRGFTQAFADNDEVPLEVVKAEQAREQFMAETRLAELRPDHEYPVHVRSGLSASCAITSRSIAITWGSNCKRDVSEDEAVAALV